jgi:hypothetical protein
MMPMDTEQKMPMIFHYSVSGRLFQEKALSGFLPSHFQNRETDHGKGPIEGVFSVIMSVR